MLANQRAAKLATNWRLRNGRVMMRIAWLHCVSILHVMRLSATVRHVRGKMGFFFYIELTLIHLTLIKVYFKTLNFDKLLPSGHTKSDKGGNL